MNDLGKILLYGITYLANKDAFESGLSLLKKQNKTQEEEIAARSFKKILICVGIMFSFSLLSVIFATLNFMLSLIFNDSSSDYVWTSLIVLLLLMIIAPIFMVISALIPRGSFGKDWMIYYNSHCK